MAKDSDDILSQSAWMLAFNGLLAVVLGLLIFFNPAISIEALVLLFGFVVFIGGLFSVAQSRFISKENPELSMYYLVGGIFNIIIGLIVLIFPPLVATAAVLGFGLLFVLLAIWMLIAGVIGFLSGFTAKSGKLVKILLSVLIVILALLVLFNPFTAVFAVTQFIGLVALVFGVFMLAMALVIALK